MTSVLYKQVVRSISMNFSRVVEGCNATLLRAIPHAFQGFVLVPNDGHMATLCYIAIAPTSPSKRLSCINTGILSGTYSGWHILRHSYFGICSAIFASMCSDILSGNLFAISSGVLSGLLSRSGPPTAIWSSWSGTPTGMFFGILSGIYSGIFSYILYGIYSDIL